MALLSMERYKVVVYIPDPSFVTFVAKIQKAKTRKNKDYFVLRTTVPKNIAEKIDAKAGDYLFFKTKKALWYHMLNWEAMEGTWKMLPDEIRNQIIMDRLFNQGNPSQVTPSLGATNLSAPTQQIVEVQSNQKW
jgi:hypothetical protein